MPARVPSRPSLLELGTYCHRIKTHTNLTHPVPASRVVSVPSTCIAGIASASTQPTGSRLHSVGVIVLFVYHPRRALNTKWSLPGASALLFLSSVPRFSKGPIPAMLTVTSAATGAYYGRAIYKVHQ